VRFQSSQAAVNPYSDDHVQPSVLETTPAENPRIRDPSRRDAPRDEDMAVGSQYPKFDTLRGKVSADTLNAITGKPLKNLVHMSAVQAAVFPRLPELAEPYDPAAPKVRDLLVKAKTGTGKTLGFLVPAVEARLKMIEREAQRAVAEAGGKPDKMLEQNAIRRFTRTSCGTLIISPTRELATQIANEAIKLTHYHKDFEVRLFVGGMSKGMQMRDWMKGRRDIAVATPGRLRDLLESEPDIRKGLAGVQTVSPILFSSTTRR
jgi:ATP-dependent RNA helicase MSS116